MAVILSGETASRSEAALESKDPYEGRGRGERWILEIRSRWELKLQSFSAYR